MEDNISEREIIEKLKIYYYTSLSSYEIREKLKINTSKYNKLLKIVKHELGIKKGTYRTPRCHGKYMPGGYAIINTINDDIYNYYPTLQSALLKNTELNEMDYEVIQVTDQDMIRLIRKYFLEKYTWEQLQDKFKLPYNRLFTFISIIKKDLGKTDYNIVNPNRYIYEYKPTGKLCIRKLVDGEKYHFGYYNNYDEARIIRDYLESINWNHTYFMDNKDKIKEELLK